jgi:hypothetical protein
MSTLTAVAFVFGHLSAAEVPLARLALAALLHPAEIKERGQPCTFIDWAWVAPFGRSQFGHARGLYLQGVALGTVCRLLASVVGCQNG